MKRISNQAFIKVFLLVIIPVLFLRTETLMAATIWQENFNSYSNGTTSSSKWTRDVSNCSFGNGDHFEVRSQLFQGRDLDGTAIWTSEVIDISSHSDVEISVTVSESGNHESDDFIQVLYKLNGGSETQFATNGYKSDDFGTVTASQATLNGSTLQLIIKMNNDHNQERHRFDNVLVEGTAAPSLTLSTTVTDVSCNGGNNGAIDLTVANGQTPYTYDWSSGQNSEDISNLAAASYTVTVTDALGATASTAASVNEPVALNASISKTDATPGNTDGAANLTPSGGTSPYTYAWSTGATTQDLNNLGAGTYTVTLTDDNSCTTSASTTINEVIGPATLFQEDFEGSVSGWNTYTFSGNGSNSWTISNTSCSINGNSLQVKTSGSFCRYVSNTHDIIAYHQVDATGYENLELTLSWICEGENGYDYGSVWYKIGNGSWTRVTSGGNGFGTYQGQNSTVTETVPLPSALDGQVFQLGFNWVNDYSIEGQPPFIVDDLTVKGTAIFPGPWVWTGAISNDWMNATNWNPNSIPTLSNDVVIPAGTPNSCKIDISQRAECRNLTIDSAAQLEVACNVADNGVLEIYGSVDNNGKLFHTGSTITYLLGNGTIEGDFYDNDENCSWYIFGNASYTLTGDFNSHEIRIASNASLDMNDFDASVYYYQQLGTINIKSGTLGIVGPEQYSIMTESTLNEGTGTIHYMSGDAAWTGWSSAINQTVNSVTFNNLRVRTNNGTTITLGQGTEFDVNGSFALYNPGTAGGIAITANNFDVAGDFTIGGNTTDGTALTLAHQIIGGGANSSFSMPSTSNTRTSNPITINFTSSSQTALPSFDEVAYNFKSKVTYDGNGDHLVMDGEYAEIELSGTGTHNLVGDLDINKESTTINPLYGDLINSTGSLDITSNNYSINLEGDWTNNATFNSRNGKVTFDGSTEQNISGSTVLSLYNTEFNNISSTGIVLGINTEISNIVAFTDGRVITGSNLLIVTNTATSAVTGQSHESFVSGYLRRYLSTGQNLNYAFPVGLDANDEYFPIEIFKRNMTGTNYLTASFGPLLRSSNNNLLNVTEGNIVYSQMYTEGMWTVDPDAQPVIGKYNVKAYTGRFTGMTDNLFGLLKRPTGSPDASYWTAGGEGHNAQNGLGRLVAHGYVIRNGLETFSEFGPGGGGTGLPIELIEFTAEANGAVVDLTWQTATEINNDFFTIERSLDGINFEEVLQVDGAGNSTTTLSYSAIDPNPYPGLSFYRLKQTDFDGTFAYSDLETVVFTTHVPTELEIYPNPNNGNFTIAVASEVRNAKVFVYDVSGKYVHFERVEQVESDLKHDMNLTRLPQGIYHLKVDLGSEKFIKKLMLK